MIAIATIGLCYLTQLVASWFGIELPDQANIEIVKRYAGLNKTFLILCAQIIIVMPVAEEFIFRYLLFRLPQKLFQPRPSLLALPYSILALLSSLLFSAAHYLFQPFPDAAFIALFYFGLAQCWLYSKTVHIWCTMLNHALFNLTNLVLLFILPTT